MSTLCEVLKSVKGEAGRQACTVLSTVTQEESKPAHTESDDSDENNAMLVDSNAIKGMNDFVKEDTIRGGQTWGFRTRFTLLNRVLNRVSNRQV